MGALAIGVLGTPLGPHEMLSIRTPKGLTDPSSDSYGTRRDLYALQGLWLRDTCRTPKEPLRNPGDRMFSTSACVCESLQCLRSL